MKTSTAGKWARMGIIVGALVIFIASFDSEILRNGNEPIAGFLALLGLFGFTAVVRIKGGISKSDEALRTKNTIWLEYLGVAALFGFGWVWVERDAFFAEGPSGRNLFLLNAGLLFALGAIFACSIFIGRAIRPIAMQPKLGKPAWTAMCTAVVVLVGLNLEARATTISVEGLGKVIIETQGFPMAATRHVRVEKSDTSESPDRRDAEIVLMPNGGRVVRTKESTIVTRFGRSTTLPRLDDVQFRDGTEVHFNGEKFLFLLPRVRPLKVDFKTEQAKFVNNGTSYRNWIGTSLNVFIAILLVAHAGQVAEALGRSRRGVRLAC